MKNITLMAFLGVLSNHPLQAITHAMRIKGLERDDQDLI